ncbi:MAG TPA: hypothetical protein VJ991_06885 [Balneolales bacterium]|nr:hypothetical protein [Balneolales bacterium]
MRHIIELFLFGLIYVLLYSECDENEDVNEANMVMDQLKDSILQA